MDKSSPDKPDKPMAELSSLPETVFSPSGKWHAIDTAPLMAMASALIVNSHLEAFYPRAFLAADGLLGNSIFFLLSGFGLQMSAAKQQPAFGPYSVRRMLRIYPTLLLCEVIFSLIYKNFWQPDARDYIYKFIYPTEFTFIRDIVPFYFLIYPWLVLKSARAYTWSMLIVTIPYLFFYIPDARQIPSNWHLSMGSRTGYMHDIAYFEVMLLGGWFGVKSHLLSRPRVVVHFCTVLTLLIYFGLKSIMVVQGHFASWYGLLHLLVFIACGLLLMSMTDPRVLKIYRAFRPIHFFVALIAALTLEIYVVHQFLLHRPWLSQIKFPLNLLVLTIITIAISWVVAEIVKPFNKMLTSWRGQQK